MTQSIDVMLKNSQLSTIPGGTDASSTLRGIQAIANAGKGSITADEYELMAKQYAAAREDLRRAFEAMTPEAQAEGKSFVRVLRAKDELRMRQMEGEEEELRLVRAKIKAENERAAAAAPPPKKKTLAELEAAQSKSFGQAPKASLYAR